MVFHIVTGAPTPIRTKVFHPWSGTNASHRLCPSGGKRKVGPLGQQAWS